MKKLLKFCVISLAMAFVLFGCANPNNTKNNESEKGTIIIPEIKPIEDIDTPSVTKPEKYEPIGKETVTLDVLKSPEFKPQLEILGKDLVYSLSEAFSGLVDADPKFKTEVWEPVGSLQGDSIKFSLEGDKHYKNDNWGLTLNLLNENSIFFKISSDATPESDPTWMTYAGKVNIDGNFSLDGSNNKIPVNSSEYSETRNSSIKALNVNAKMNGAANVIFDFVPVPEDKRDPQGPEDQKAPNVKSIEGGLALALNGKALFDTDKYAGYVTLNEKLTVEDANAVYEKVLLVINGENTEILDVLKKLSNYYDWYVVNNSKDINNELWGKPEPAFPDDNELESLYTWLDGLGVKMEVSVSVTDVTDSNPQSLITINKVSDYFKNIVNFIKPKSSANA